MKGTQITLLVLFLAATFVAYADNHAGVVSFAKGEAFVQRSDGKRVPIEDQDLVYSGDSLMTGDGLLQIKFLDGALMSIQKNSEMRIDDFAFHGSENGSESALFSLLKGGLRAISGAIGHARPSRYQLRTSVATIGIRGTAYSALLCQGDCSPLDGKVLADGLHARTTEGTIFVQNQAGLLDVPAGQAAFVSNNATLPTFTDFNPTFSAIIKRAEQMAEAKSKKKSGSGTRRDGKKTRTVHHEPNDDGVTKEIVDKPGEMVIGAADSRGRSIRPVRIDGVVLNAKPLSRAAQVSPNPTTRGGTVIEIGGYAAKPAQTTISLETMRAPRIPGSRPIVAKPDVGETISKTTTVKMPTIAEPTVSTSVASVNGMVQPMLVPTVADPKLSPTVPVAPIIQALPTLNAPMGLKSGGLTGSFR